MPAARAILQGNPGRVALIVVTDSENILQGRAFTTVQKLSYFLSGRLCIYPIQVELLIRTVTVSRTAETSVRTRPKA